MEGGKSLELIRSASKFDSLAWVVSEFLGVIDDERRKAMKPQVLLAAASVLNIRKRSKSDPA
jgi:hypothetical protein